MGESVTPRFGRFIGCQHTGLHVKAQQPSPPHGASVAIGVVVDVKTATPAEGTRVSNLASDILPKSQPLEVRMQTSRFQLGLIATLAVGLGFSLASSDAVGYPSTAVSMGTNPLWSKGGTSSDVSLVIVTAPDDRDMVLTDLSLSTSYDYDTKAGLDVGEEAAGRWTVSGKDGEAYSATTFGMSMTSGIRVPAGQTLSLTTQGQPIDYFLSGYYAQP